MDQKFEGIPAAVIRLDGNRLVRGHVSNDWGLRLQWKISRGEETVATSLARISPEHDLQELPPGTYGAILQMWKYVNYKKDKDGEFTASQYVDISNSIEFEVSPGGQISPIRITQPAATPQAPPP